MKMYKLKIALQSSILLQQNRIQIRISNTCCSSIRFFVRIPVNDKGPTAFLRISGFNYKKIHTCCSSIRSVV